MNSKITNYKEAKELIKESKDSSLLVTGDFDIVHLGHVKFLKECKSLGGKLFVGLEKDQTITNIKGIDKPYNILNYRLEFLSELETVDYVFSFEEELTIYNSKKSKLVFINRLEFLKPTTWLIPKWDPFKKQKIEQAKKANIYIKLLDLDYSIEYW